MASAKTKKTTASKSKTTRKGSSRGKAAATKKPAAKAKGSDKEVTVERRSSGDRRNKADRRKKSEPVGVERRKIQRRAKVNRRRQIDPTTCERDYSDEELEFMSALEEYKRTSGRMFPTCSEILEVLKKLGYAKCAAGENGPATASERPADSTDHSFGGEGHVASDEPAAAAELAQ